MTRPTSLPVPVLLRKRHLASVIMHEWPRAEEWRTWQKAQQLSTRTIDARIFRVYELAAFTDNPPAEATTEQIVRYMASVSARAGYREDKVRPATMATYHSHLRAWFAWLVKMEYRDDDPMMRVPTPRRGRSRPRPVTDREMLAVFAVGVHKRTRMMLLLAAFQGLRVHEIAKIRGEHVNLLDSQLRVIGKGNHDATLPLHPLVASFAVTFPRTGYWFPTNATGQAAANGSVVPVQARSVSGIISDVFNRAGVDGGAHRLRHWYATTLLKGGANTRLVQTLMRHGSIQSTEIYTEIAEVDQAAALSRLGMPAAQDEQQSA